MIRAGTLVPDQGLPAHIIPWMTGMGVEYHTNIPSPLWIVCASKGCVMGVSSARLFSVPELPGLMALWFVYAVGESSLMGSRDGL